MEGKKERVYNRKDAGVPPPQEERIIFGSLQVQQDLESIRAENAKMLKNTVNSLQAFRRANSHYINQESRCIDMQLSHLISAISSEDMEDTVASELNSLKKQLGTLSERISEIEQFVQESPTRVFVPRLAEDREIQCYCTLF